MTRIFLTLACLAAAGPASARSLESLVLAGQAFEAFAAQPQTPAAPKDPFEGVAECQVLDAQFLKALTLAEAADTLRPCAEAALALGVSEPPVSIGLLPGSTKAPGLVVRANGAPGSPEHRGLAAAVARRGGFLLGHPVKVLGRGQAAPPPPSALQAALDACMIPTVVRKLRSSADFIQIYGGCFTRETALKIDAVKPGAGLSATVVTRASEDERDAYAGFVTVNAGSGPVHVVIKAEAPPTPAAR